MSCVGVSWSQLRPDVTWPRDAHVHVRGFMRKCLPTFPQKQQTRIHNPLFACATRAWHASGAERWTQQLCVEKCTFSVSFMVISGMRMVLVASSARIINLCLTSCRLCLRKPLLGLLQDALLRRVTRHARRWTHQRPVFPSGRVVVEALAHPCRGVEISRLRSASQDWTRFVPAWSWHACVLIVNHRVRHAQVTTVKATVFTSALLLRLL